MDDSHLPPYIIKFMLPSIEDLSLSYMFGLINGSLIFVFDENVDLILIKYDHLQ